MQHRTFKANASSSMLPSDASISLGLQEHALFRNPMTAKRFPELAAIPTEQLALYFQVTESTVPRPPTDALQQSVKSTDARVLGALKAPKRPPFRPCNPSEARGGIRNGSCSVFRGAEYDSVKICSAEARQRHQQCMQLIGRQQFSPVCPSLAKQAIQSSVFQNSSSADALLTAKLTTHNRAREGLQKYQDARIGRVNKPPLAEQ
eukprot:gene12904-19900_t